MMGDLSHATLTANPTDTANHAFTRRTTTPKKRGFQILSRLDLITRGIAVLAASVIVCIPAHAPAATFTSARVGYAITLPDSWRRQMRNDSTHSFYDSSAVHGSQIFVVRRTCNPALFPTPDSWTRAHFMAYKIAVDYSGYPYAGTVLYFDSTAGRKVNNLWAPEIYATYLLADTLNPANPPVAAWSDFTKIMAKDGFGYEVYAVGDTADMLRYVGYYDTLMMTTVLTPPAISALARDGRTPVYASPRVSAGVGFTWDLLGREVDTRKERSGASASCVRVSRTSRRIGW